MKPEIILNAITLMCVCCQTPLLFVGAIVAIWQIAGSRKAHLLGAVWEILTQLDTPEMVAAREFVYAHKELYLSLEGSDEKYKGLSKEERTNAELVSSSLSRVGYVVSHKLIPPKLILDGYHFMVTRCWHILEPYIKAVRIDRKNREYQKFFEDLAERARWDYPASEEEQTYTSSPPHESERSNGKEGLRPMRPPRVKAH